MVASSARGTAPMKVYQVIDTLNGNEVVASRPTHRMAYNAARKLEPTESLRRPYNPNAPHEGAYKDWRYLIRCVNH
jgi:hypothetical protein